MTKTQKTYLYFKAVNNGKRATKPVEVFEKQAVEAKEWDRLLWYKWDRVVQYQSGDAISVFDHEGE